MSLMILSFRTQARLLAVSFTHIPSSSVSDDALPKEFDNSCRMNEFYRGLFQLEWARRVEHGREPGNPKGNVKRQMNLKQMTLEPRPEMQSLRVCLPITCQSTRGKWG